MDENFFKELDVKWQKFWENEKIFKSVVDPGKSKYYVLEMYPYPSGELHMGHVRNYILGDVVARYKWMKNFNVLHPIGWDAFGLPTENAAFERNIEPSQWNKICTERMAKQFRSLGISYDWERTIDTSDPRYYRWTQWLLIRFWEKGLLYRDKKEVNWCTGCNTVLANEQVTDSYCNRCGSMVVPKEMEQWFLKITAYADRLLEDLKLLTEWPPRVVAMQRHWIGKSDNGSYKLRDWCISRQRYWGAPIPFVICSKCGIQPVPDYQLPLMLPEGVDISPGWPPPLARIPSFVETSCPKCFEKAERVTDTLDTFVFSAWYFLRFTDPHNSEQAFNPLIARYWMPVDQYVGGIEHATVHLVYARFFQKFLFDLGLVSDPEPFRRLFTQGMVCRDGKKMSKSKGNVVTPDDLLEDYGADTIRLYTLFLGPPELDVEWNDHGIKGCSRFLKFIASILETIPDWYESKWINLIGDIQLEEKDLIFRRATHRAIKRITDSIEKDFHFHTAISALMDWVSLLDSYQTNSPNNLIMSEAIENLCLLLSPFAPHIAEEIWSKLGSKESVCKQLWPMWDEKLCEKEEVQFIVQVNGKTRDVITIPIEVATSQEAVEQLIFSSPKFSKFRSETVVRKIFIPQRLINFVTKS